MKANFLLFLSSFILLSCGSSKSTVENKLAKKINFTNYINTTTKKIDVQQKRDFLLEDLGITASNKFDGARLNNFKKLNDSTALVIIDPENTPINNSAYYAFKIWSKQAKTFYLKFDYPEDYSHRYIPKLKVNNKWSVINPKEVFKKSESTIIKLNLSKDTLTVAAQEVHNSKDVKNWYMPLVNTKKYVNYFSSGKSVLGKDLPVLDIFKGDKKNKDIIVLLTRQHPPELTGYYAFKNFLKTILNESVLSTEFLNKYRVLAFPILNPDGVDMGHWRHNYGGVDLNRDWSKYNQKEIENVVNFIEKAKQETNVKVLLGLDFHSIKSRDVFYTNKDTHLTSMPSFLESWFTAMEKNISGYRVNSRASGVAKPVSKAWFLKAHEAVGVTYETADDTPLDFINLKSKVAANEMMKILLIKKI